MRCFQHFFTLSILVFIEKPLINYVCINYFSQKHSSIEQNYQLTSIFARKYISLSSSLPNFNKNIIYNTTLCWSIGNVICDLRSECMKEECYRLDCYRITLKCLAKNPSNY